MDPNDLLFLHATLAASIRSQRDEIGQLRIEVAQLRQQLTDLTAPEPEEFA